MLVKTYGCAVYGINATKVTVEVNVGQGAFFMMVGLPDNAVKESQQRIDSALKNNGYKTPIKGITVNLAPADIKKEGSSYDLTIAIGLLAATELIQWEKVNEYVIMGELSLDGEIRPIKGILPIAIKAAAEKFKGIILPKANALEAAVVSELDVLGVENIRDVIDFFNGKKEIKKTVVNTDENFSSQHNDTEFDFQK